MANAYAAVKAAVIQPLCLSTAMAAVPRDRGAVTSCETYE